MNYLYCKQNVRNSIFDLKTSHILQDRSCSFESKSQGHPTLRILRRTSSICIILITLVFPTLRAHVKILITAIIITAKLSCKREWNVELRIKSMERGYNLLFLWSSELPFSIYLVYFLVSYHKY